MSNLESCSSGNEDAPMIEFSAYVLEPIREGPDFTHFIAAASTVAGRGSWQ